MTNPFLSNIQIINSNPYVQLPETTLQAIFAVAGRSKSPIPVRGKINGVPFQQSLVRYQGDWRLYINGEMAKKAGLTYRGSISAIVGVKVSIAIVFDTSPRQYAMPKRFAIALRNDIKAHAAYQLLSSGRKKEILRYLGLLKTHESLERNVKRVIAHLRGDTSDALYALMHRKRVSDKDNTIDS